MHYIKYNQGRTTIIQNGILLNNSDNNHKYIYKYIYIYIYKNIFIVK